MEFIDPPPFLGYFHPMSSFEAHIRRWQRRNADPAYKAQKRIYDHERYLKRKASKEFTDREAYLAGRPPRKAKLTPEERKIRWKRQETDRRKRRAADNREYIRSLKLAGKCIDCGFSEHPYALEFDHVDGPKLFDINRLKRSTRARLDRELAKCVLRCANCHRIRTAKWEREPIEW
jgi:hypothetical protein